jgi:ParB-like chromosome segregation protein Spo0J
METGNVMIDAQTAFARARRRRRRARVLGWLLRRSGADRQLPLLHDELRGRPPGARRQAGLATIPLCSIVGTAESAKARTFDRSFLPSGAIRLRWERLWIAGRRGAALPPISVYRLDDRHFVDDGHHRVSVARALGMSAIDAEVTELSRAPEL